MSSPNVTDRVTAELDRMNFAAQQLNAAETALVAARADFRRRLGVGVARLSEARATAGAACVERARPAHEARRRCRQVQAEARAAAATYQRAEVGTPEAAAAAAEHARLADRCHALEAAAGRLERSLRASAARRAALYFEACERQRQLLAEQKQRVELLEEKLRLCKRLYKESMATLEAISESVHQARQKGQDCGGGA